jgi:hypothetical protein
MPALIAPLHSPFIHQVDFRVVQGRLDKKLAAAVSLPLQVLRQT